MGPQGSAHSSDLRAELSRVLASQIFERAQRSQRFLRYLVDAALSEPPVVVKEYTVAIDVFDRDSTYDPAVDATVRVEASRLRSRLREYYAEEGRDNPCQIDVPKGSYAVLLKPRSSGEPSTLSSAEVPVAPGLASDSRAKLPSTALPPTVDQVRFWIVGIGVLALAVIAVSVAVWRHRRPQIPVTVASGPVSLAIVPIANHTGDPNLNYIADGLTDDLIRQLSTVPALRLIGRTTMFRYRDRAADAEGIARSLHVGAIMTGEFRRTGDGISLAVEVTRTGDGSVLLDREYIAGPGDLPTAQADLQNDVLRNLHVESSALDPGRALHSVTSDPAAYQEFLKAVALARTNAPADMQQAIVHSEKAVALDPQFDLAWSTLASEHLFLGTYFEPPREQIPMARNAAERAIQLNPSLGEAHGSLGLIHLTYDWNIPAAEAEMGTAGAEAASIGTLTCAVHLMERGGKSRTAEEILDRMLTYDPESASLIAELGCVDFYRGDYDAAIRHYRDALQQDPHTPVAFWGIGKTLNAQGKHAEAIKVLRSFKEQNGFEPPIITAEIGYALGASGQREQAMNIIHQLSTPHGPGFVDPYFVSIVYLSMNDLDSAFRWLNQAMDVRSSFAISILTEPKWAPVRNDRRFAEAVQRMLTSKA